MSKCFSSLHVIEDKKNEMNFQILINFQMKSFYATGAKFQNLFIPHGNAKRECVLSINYFCEMIT